MNTRNARLSDKETILELLDEFRADCIEQITVNPAESNTARTRGKKIYEALLSRADYAILFLVNDDTKVVGIITGYILPMLRSGQKRAEVEEFFVQEAYRGNGNAKLLMDAFFEWCNKQGVKKVKLESDNELARAHGFYKKYGFESKAQRFVKQLS